MPHIQIADAIVQYGRESLERVSSSLPLCNVESLAGDD
jgi:hypothetical protein